MRISKTRQSVARAVTALPVFLLLGLQGSQAEEPAPFTLQGSFENKIEGKHHSGGGFNVRASGNSALIDVTFENGYREITGTDGRDTFNYVPFYGDKSSVTNPNRREIFNGQGVISDGRFPIEAHFLSQLLWLACTHDPAVFTNLQPLRFPFYGTYREGEIVPRIETNSDIPNLISSIRWYAPNKMRVPGGTDLYNLAMYTNGYLAADLRVAETKSVGRMTLPKKIIFTVYKTWVITNANQLSQLRPRSPDDVLPLTVATYFITNAQKDSALSSYVPEIVDAITSIRDTRKSHDAVRWSSAKSWTVEDSKREKDIRRNNSSAVPLTLVALFLVISLIPVYLVVRRKKTREKHGA
jgi:hypothetical protein